MIVCFVGFASSGKGTAGKLLTDMGYVEDSFAAPLKDALSAIFGWPRHLLEGDTPESRKFRETTDVWWSKRLGFDLSPRKAMQNIGTDVFRKYFNDGLWIMSLEQRFYNRDNKNVVVTDGRFPNEIRLLKNLGAKIIRIKKGPEPEWYETALNQNLSLQARPYSFNDPDHPIFKMQHNYPEIHSSEWSWIGCPDIDLTIENDGTVEELHENIKKAISIG